MFYAESWKLVHMLHLHPEYQPHFSDLLRALPKSDPEQAFRKAYGKSLDTVQRDLQAYLSNGAISAMLWDIKLPKSIDAPEIEQGAAMSARLAIAEMLSNNRGRSAQAHAAYTEIARDYPGRWEVEEAMGLFAWHERKLDEANQHFAKAEELGCKDGSMFLLWGRVLGYANRSGDAVMVLGKASKMMNESNEVQLEYGNALVLNGNWGSAVAALRTVDVSKIPATGKWRYYYNLAYGLYRLGDTANAKTQAAKAQTYAATVRETSSLDQLRAALDHPVRSAAPPRDDSDGEAPRLVRRDSMPAQPAEGPKSTPLPAVEGTLENMECGKLARLHVRVDGVVKIFVIPVPSKISIASGSGEPVELECGTQKKAAALRIEYQPMPGTLDVTGLVRTLAFK